jgi:hypothetical protein
MAFKIPYLYDYVTKLCRAQAEVILNHVNPKLRGIEQGETRHEKYRDIFRAIDEFTALRFTVTGAPPAARRIRILPMTQHALRPITFGMKENN